MLERVNAPAPLPTCVASRVPAQVPPDGKRHDIGIPVPVDVADYVPGVGPRRRKDDGGAAG